MFCSSARSERDDEKMIPDVYDVDHQRTGCGYRAPCRAVDSGRSVGGSRRSTRSRGRAQAGLRTNQIEAPSGLASYNESTRTSVQLQSTNAQTRGRTTPTSRTRQRAALDLFRGVAVFQWAIVSMPGIGPHGWRQPIVLA